MAAARTAIGNFASMVDPLYANLTTDNLVSKLMKGMVNHSPPVKAYNQIWNPQQLLQHLESLPDNVDLSLLQLTRKVAALAALVTGSRCQSIHQIDIGKEKMVRGEDCYCCQMPLQLKPSRQQDKEQVLHLPKYNVEKLCVHSAVTCYLEHTKPLCKSDSGPLFLITQKQFTPATGSTVSRWIREMMEQAGIDTSIYKTHSTRKSSTSAAEASVPLATILRAAAWRSASTFAQYYRLPVVQHDQFAAAVLNPGVVAPISHINIQK